MKELDFILYSLPEEDGKVQVVVKDETIWCTQKAMAQLFGVGVPAISKHISHIFEEGELSLDATVSKMEIVQTEGSRSIKRDTDFYNLDAIIAVGYRVNSLRATRFRQWATTVLKEYIRKGYGTSLASINKFIDFPLYQMLSNKGSVIKLIAD